jgi:hypothetical protein
MLDRQIISTGGSIIGAVAASVAIVGGGIELFRSNVGTIGATAISTMALLLLAILILSVDNRLKIDDMDGSENE